MVVAVSLISTGALPRLRRKADERVPDHPMFTDAWYPERRCALGRVERYGESQQRCDRRGRAHRFRGRHGPATRRNLIGLFDVRWHFTKRWQLEVEYQPSWDRDNEKQIQRVIDWGNLNIPINGVAKGSFNIEDFRVGVGYSFFRSKDKEVGVGLGAHVAKLEAGLSTRNLGSEVASQDSAAAVPHNVCAHGADRSMAVEHAGGSALARYRRYRRQGIQQRPGPDLPALAAFQYLAWLSPSSAWSTWRQHRKGPDGESGPTLALRPVRRRLYGQSVSTSPAFVDSGQRRDVRDISTARHYPPPEYRAPLATRQRRCASGVELAASMRAVGACAAMPERCAAAAFPGGERAVLPHSPLTTKGGV